MTPDPLTKALRYRWLIFGILAIGYGLVFFHRLCPAVVAVDMMQDLRVGGTLIGVLSSAYFYPYALMQLPAGLLADSWGARRTVALFSVVAFAGSLLLGLAPSISWAILGRVLVGLGVSMVFVPALKVVAEWFRAEEFARMTGILMVVGGIGSLTAATPLAVLSAAIGWRMALILIGALSLGLAAAVWAFVRDRPTDLGWPPVSSRSSEEPAAIPLAQGLRQVLIYGPFWIIAVWFFFGGAVSFSFVGLWGGPYLQHVHGFSKGQAGHVLSMFSIGVIVGSSFLSFASNRLDRARKSIMVGASGFNLCLMSVLVLFISDIPLAALYFVCFGFGCVTSALVVFGYTVAKELFPIQLAGTATGFVNLFPFAGGAVFQPVLGYILERYGVVEGVFTLAGYRAAFLTLVGCAAVGFLAITRLKETASSESARLRSTV